MRSKWPGACLLAALAICLWPCGAARADIIVRSDHSAASGKVISQSATEVVFLPDGAASPQHIPRDQIMQVILTDAQGHVLPSAPANPAPNPAVNPPANFQPGSVHLQWGLAQEGPRPPVAVPPAHYVQLAPGARHLTIVAMMQPPSPYVSDEEIGSAIERGARYLASRFEDSLFVESGKFAISQGPEGQGPDKVFNTRPAAEDEEKAIRAVRQAGADALAVYALLQCGMATNDPQFNKDSKFMKPLIDKMKTLSSSRYDVYARALRATCLSLIDRPEDRTVLEADVRALLDGCSNGGYSYACPVVTTQVNNGVPVQTDHGIVIDRSRTTVRTVNQAPYDNSNSQYGLLGVWSAAEVGGEIPPNYWQAVQQHWAQCQCANGQWAYQGNTLGTYSMTMAGLASMFVCHDYIDLARFGQQVGREPLSPSLDKGLEWMETGNNSVPPAENDGYSIYGLERVGLASGFKYFGTHDWYREVATELVHSQSPDGWWNDNFQLGLDCDTAYMLLFLSRGRHPILMNKLRFERYWDNRPRDAANLANYASTQLESPINWQVVDLKHDWPDWTDSPILYIASQAAPRFTDPDYAKIRAFVNSGGMLFTQADGDSEDFNEYAQGILAKKLFPEYPLQPVPADSPIFSVFAPIKVKPRLLAVSNGARLLWVHSPTDVGIAWQQRAIKTRQQTFDLGMDLFIYAAGKRDFQNRIATNYIPEPPDSSPGNVVKVARVKYSQPTWDPEPYAWTRLANYLQWQTSVRVQTQAVEMEKLGDLSPSDVPLAHLTGTKPFAFTDAQIAGLQKYVSNGGIVFIDACGGGAFNDSVKALLDKALPKVEPEQLLASSSLLRPILEGMSELSPAPPVRQYVTSLGKKAAGFEGYGFGKGLVIYSPMDVTNGLLGSQTWGVSGYTGAYCLQFMKNLVIWSAQGAPIAGGSQADEKTSGSAMRK